MISRTMGSRRTTVSEFDGDGDLRAFASAVSLHAHTHHSRESLADVPEYIAQIPFLGRRFVRELRSCLDEEGCAADYSRVWWHPPVSARAVFESEAGQIEDRLGLSSLVSVTDHDDISAGLELQTLYAARRAPISVEWTVPFGDGFFHLGIHNLPPPDAVSWFARLRAVTASPALNSVADALADLDALDETLIVFNHPHWDLADVGRDAHARSVRDFLNRCGRRLHALEINGYRSWPENDSVLPVAAALGLPVISGGDRHGSAPNALLNVTRAQSFAEFVAEVRGGSATCWSCPNTGGTWRRGSCRQPLMFFGAIPCPRPVISAGRTASHGTREGRSEHCPAAGPMAARSGCVRQLARSVS